MRQGGPRDRRAAGVLGSAISRLHERRRRRLRIRRGAEERDRDRVRRLRRLGLRRQHQGSAAHSWPSRDRAAGDGVGRPERDVLRTHGDGGPDHDRDQSTQPQSRARRAPRAWRDVVADPRQHGDGRRGSEYRASGARTGAASPGGSADHRADVRDLRWAEPAGSAGCAHDPRAQERGVKGRSDLPSTKMEANGDSKLYRSISEVSDLVGVKPHVLRYWETQFGMLRPRKNRAGKRMYRPEELRTLQRIKELLYERRFTIAGARRKLLEERKDGVEQTEPGFADADRKAALTEIKSELRSILGRLKRERG